MISTSDFKKGLKLVFEGQPYEITDFEHIKPGKGNQFSRVKLRHLIKNNNLEKTIKSGEKFEQPDVLYSDYNFLYQDDSGYNFMNPESFDQITLMDAELGDSKNFLMENMRVKVLFLDEKPCSIEIPNTVNLTVSETVPGVKGNTVTGATKPATLETGLVVNVPLHIKEGDILKIDTRSSDYLERVNK